MLMFLASILEQMDLASEHIAKRDVHNARFGLMLTDNAVELVLHRIAMDHAAKLRAYPFLREEYPHKGKLEEALGVLFDPKVSFARLIGALSDENRQTIAILHGFRNEIYHVGIQHEAVLPDLAAFYFDTACRFLAGWKPDGFWWSSNQRLPERAKKYFNASSQLFPGEPEDFAAACGTLVEALGHDPDVTVAALADHADQVISEADTSLDVAAGGVYDNQRRSRDQAIRECQAWPLAFTDKGRAFAKSHGWKGKNLIQLSDWLAENYPVQFKHDPIPSWRKRADKLRVSKSAHLALSNYHSFMKATGDVRDALSEAARQIDEEIDRLIDARRGG
jgi:hypothetical protein